MVLAWVARVGRLPHPEVAVLTYFVRRVAARVDRASGGCPYFYLMRPEWMAMEAASARVPASSLARTAPTWWSTVFGEMNRRSAISLLLNPSAMSARTSNCRSRQSRGVLSRARSGAAQEAAHAAGAQHLTQLLRGRPRPQSVEDPKRRAPGRFVAVRQRHRFVVRTTDRSPRRGGSAPVAPHLKRVRCGNCFIGFGSAAGAPQPEAELPTDPGIVMPLRHLEDETRFALHAFDVSFEPGGFSARRGDRRDAALKALRVPRRQRARLVQRAPPRPDRRGGRPRPSTASAANLRGGPHSIMPQHKTCVVRPRRPESPCSKRARPRHAVMHRSVVEIQVVLRVGDAMPSSKWRSASDNRVLATRRTQRLVCARPAWS